MGVLLVFFGSGACDDCVGSYGFVFVVCLLAEAAYRAAATYFLLLRQKKVSKEKATLLPAFSCGARLRGAPQNSLRGCAASFKQLRRFRWTKRVCPAAHTPPHRLCASEQVEGPM